MHTAAAAFRDPMNPYRDPSSDSPRRERVRRFVKTVVPRPLSVVVLVGALGWPAFFAAPLVQGRAREADGKQPAAEIAPSARSTPIPEVEETKPEPEAEANPEPASSASAEPSAAPAEVLLPPRAARASVSRAAREVVAALEAGDYAKLAQHGAIGGIDVAASWVELDRGAHFSAESLKRCARDRRKRAYRESAEETRTCAAFFTGLLYDEKFSESARIEFNAADADDPIALELRKGRPGAIIADHHVFAGEGSGDGDPGPEERHLYLIFVPEADAWRLAAITGS